MATRRQHFFMFYLFFFCAFLVLFWSRVDFWSCVSCRWTTWLNLLQGEEKRKKKGFSVPQPLKNLLANAGQAGSVPEWGKSPGEGKGNPLQSSCLENPTDTGVSWATCHGVTKCWTWLKWLRTHVKEKKEEFFILPPPFFFENKGDKENWAGLNILSFFYFNCS